MTKFISFIIFLLVSLSVTVQAADSWETVLGGGDGVNAQAGPKEQDLKEGEWQDVLGKTWEALDSYHVTLISTLQGANLTEEERMAMLDNLIESRYQFVEQLEQGNQEVEKAEDIFIQSWGKTEELLKQHEKDSGQQGQVVSGAIQSARKATSQLKKDSGNGLAIAVSAKDTLKKETENRDQSVGQESQNLRSFFGMDLFVHEIEDRRDRPKKEEKEPAARTESVPATAPSETHQWLVTKENFDDYLAQAKELLQKNIEQVFSSGKLAEEYRDLYKTFIYSAAWQESCLRQFSRKNGEVRYLRSYNGTSVGFMQINERVWKDIYDRELLRHDIEYNIKAGCEIAYLYLHRYALGKMKKRNLEGKLSDETLSRTLYAMYNGGPGEFSKFLGRIESGAFYDSDKLYYQKYKWVKADDWEKLKRCLF